MNVVFFDEFDAFQYSIGDAALRAAGKRLFLGRDLAFNTPLEMPGRNCASDCDVLHRAYFQYSIGDAKLL